MVADAPAGPGVVWGGLECPMGALLHRRRDIMRKHGLISLILVVSLTAGTRSAAAQTLPPCTADSGGRAGMLSYLKRLAPATDTASTNTKTALHIPTVAASQVTAVTTASICTSAGQAVSRVLGVTPPNGRSVAVIKVGNAYVVKDPTVLTGDWTEHFVFNNNFQILWSRYGP